MFFEALIYVPLPARLLHKSVQPPGGREPFVVYTGQASPRASDSSTKLEEIAAKWKLVSVDMFLAMAIPLLRARNPFAIAYNVKAILNEFVSSPVVGQRAIEDMLPSAIKKHTEEHNALDSWSFRTACMFT